VNETPAAKRHLSKKVFDLFSKELGSNPTHSKQSGSILIH
jgi:hypothetical protein